MSEPVTPGPAPSPAVAKKPYNTPQLRDFGDVAGATAAVTNVGSAGDGGGGPNFYSS